MTDNPLRHCMSGEAEEMVDQLLGPFLLQQRGKNDMALVNAFLAAAAIVIAEHCRRTGENFDELADMMRGLFATALDISGEGLTERK